MKIVANIFFILIISIFGCQTQTVENNQELQELVNQDQQDRMSESDEPISPKDDLRRRKLFELISENKIITAQDKLNAALILHHTGMIFLDGNLKSKSVENYYLAFQYSKSAYNEGLDKAKNYVAVTFDRYSWMANGYQRYGTQTTYVNGKPYWVKIDTSATDEERKRYGIEPLKELLKKQPML